jgi:hypothetical protein
MVAVVDSGVTVIPRAHTRHGEREGDVVAEVQIYGHLRWKK